MREGVQEGGDVQTALVGIFPSLFPFFFLSCSFRRPGDTPFFPFYFSARLVIGIGKRRWTISDGFWSDMAFGRWVSLLLHQNDAAVATLAIAVMDQRVR